MIELLKISKILKNTAVLAVLVFGIFFNSIEIYAQEENMAEQQLKYYNFNEIEAVLENEENEIISIDFKDILRGILKGENYIKKDGLIKGSIKALFKEILGQMDVMKNILIVCILSGIFKIFLSEFKCREISEIGFYICYTVVAMLAFGSFIGGLEIITGMIEKIRTLIEASAPVLAAMLVTNVQANTAAASMPMIMAYSGVVGYIIPKLFIPLMKFSAVICVINYMTEQDILTRLNIFLNKGTAWGLKILAFGFMAVISFSKIGTGAFDSALGKSVGAGIGAVPVVGDIFSGAAQTAVAWAGVLKTSFGLAVVITMAVLAVLPIIKIAALILIYKVSAILIEPFGDKRMVMLLDSIGGQITMALSAMVTVIITMMFSVIVVISAIGG